MRDALQKAREELGADAVLLHTRQVEGRTIFGKRTRWVEVDACRGEADAARIERREEGFDAAGEAPTHDGDEPAATDAIQREIESLEAMIDRLSADLASPAAARGASPGSPLEARLRGLELADDLVQECLAVAEREGLDSADPEDPALTAALVEHLARRIPTDAEDDLGIPRGRVAFVGPPGVGKTTALAKLAALLKDEGRRVRFVGLDDRRIGGEWELRRYAEILGVRCQFARDAEDARALVAGGADDEVVLIDTPGTGCQDRRGIARLLARLPAGVETWLILAANLRDSHLRASLDAFKPFGYVRLILTKLDETPCAGAAANVASRSAAPVRFASAGPSVASGLAAVDAAWLAAWSLGAPAPASQRRSALGRRGAGGNSGPMDFR
jgi:flagellar biosynthesis protein FlhF